MYTLVGTSPYMFKANNQLELISINEQAMVKYNSFVGSSLGFTVKRGKGPQVILSNSLTF